MTLLDSVYRYGLPPGEQELRALNAAREVYGFRAIKINEKEKTIRVEYDASRLSDDQVESLLRRAGVDIESKVALV